MKSLMFLWRVVAEDLATQIHTSATRDYKTVTSRVKTEGDSFLTITLPSVANALERGLEEGFWDPALCSSFKHRRGLPQFLGGFLDLVFDRDTGRLLDAPSVDAIFAVRQLSLMYKKILLPCSDARVRGAMDGFVQCEMEVSDWNWYSDSQRSAFRRMSSLLFADVLTDVEHALYEGELIPRHGPGATADGLRGNKKYSQVEWPRRLEDVFSYIEYALPNFRHHGEVEGVTFLEPEAERPVRVISVPKTLKTPRIIAIEPTCMQFMQQAISNRLVQDLESKHIGFRGHKAENLSYGFLGFSQQDPNRIMAKEGSHSGELATLDMSEASDRVSNQHVVDLFRSWPYLSDAVQAVRSTKADVDGWGVIPLAKYASMGSALTFPVEAMVFLTVVFMGLEKMARRQFTKKDIRSFKGKVRVYGDDIIIPNDSVSFVITELEGFGFRVNSNKSFWKGKFRESCGGDYYDGEWVTPVYVRRSTPRSRSDVDEVVSFVSFRNQLYQAGLWTAARRLDAVVEGVLPHFPTIHSTSPLLGRHSFLSYQVDRMSNVTHSPIVRGYEARYTMPHSELDGIGALYKCLLLLHQRGELQLSWLYPESTDSEHLKRAGRGRAAGLKLVWRPPY